MTNLPSPTKRRMRSSRSRGVTYIEVMVSALILAVCLGAMVSMWYFSFSMTNQTSAQGAGYAIGRRLIERAKLTGFYNTPLTPASATYYYDASGQRESATNVSGSVYSGTVTVSCDQTTTDTAGNTVPADAGLMTVTVTVTQLATNATVYTTSGTMCRAGI